LAGTAIQHEKLRTAERFSWNKGARNTERPIRHARGFVAVATKKRLAWPALFR